ncbi:hypothetical protein ACU4GD_36265 [Cupriavidus basilensis]
MAMDAGRRLYLAHPAYVCGLLLPRRLRRGPRSDLRLGRLVLLRQPRGPGERCCRRRRADLARRAACAGDAASASDRCAPRRGAAGQRAALAPPRHGLAATGARPEVSVLCAWWPDGVGASATAPLPHPRAPRDLRHAAACGRPCGAAAEFGFDPARHLPPSASWMVSSFRLRGFPPEAAGVPLAWDNVVHGGRGLGYVVSTHQLIRQAMPAATVFTAYCPLDAAADPARRRARSPILRRWLAEASPAELMDYATTDLRTACRRAFWRHADDGGDHRARACHGLAAHRFSATPAPRRCARADGRVLFAHADLSGVSVFEEAAWWGTRAAQNPRLSVGM